MVYAFILDYFYFNNMLIMNVNSTVLIPALICGIYNILVSSTFAYSYYTDKRMADIKCRKNGELYAVWKIREHAYFIVWLVILIISSLLFLTTIYLLTCSQ